MKSVGIREAKGRLSELARAAANGEPTLLTDYHKPLAVITSIEEGAPATRPAFRTSWSSSGPSWPFRIPLTSISSSIDNKDGATL